MVKRIVSGIFALAALAALGVIIGGALASGEQLIVRFLTAVIVAALALYVISDIRLKSEPVEAVRETAGTRPPVPVEAVPTRPPASVESMTATNQLGAGGRSLEPAARITDSITITKPRRTQPPAPPAAITAPVESTNGSGKIAQSPDPANVEPDKADLGPDSDDRTTNDVYLPVGSESYEGSLTTPAGNGPATAPDQDPPRSAKKVDTEKPAPQPPISPVLAEIQAVTNRLSKQSAADGVDRVEREASLPSDPSESASLVDLARTTASYAGPARTPVIDLREPVTSELPVNGSEAEKSSDESAEPEKSVAASTASLTAPIPESGTPVVTRSKPAVASTDGSVSKPAAATPPQSREQRIAAAIAGGERKVIETLIRQGMLTTSGPITDRDVRTMVYVAFTSNELRKIITAGGRVSGSDAKLGPVELFDEGRYRPVPKTLYTGRSQPGQPPTPASAGLIQHPMPAPGLADVPKPREETTA